MSCNTNNKHQQQKPTNNSNNKPKQYHTHPQCPIVDKKTCTHMQLFHARAPTDDPSLFEALVSSCKSEVDFKILIVEQSILKVQITIAPRLTIHWRQTDLCS